MKCSESWLREWVNPNLSLSNLCNKLTMAGLEVESCTPVSENFSHVVVGEIVSITDHPAAEQLKVCQVKISEANDILQIVCGAKNVRPNLKVAVALVGAKLPEEISIQITQIRGIKSEGMLCSLRELSLATTGEGIFELPQEAPIGKLLWDYLSLDDVVIDISITPNRGDCLSVKGMAREIAALTSSQLIEPVIPPMVAQIEDVIPVEVAAPEACPLYIGRIIRNVKTDISTPIWLKERLRRSGIRSINTVVDVVNYVMLELGQPMHAFDLQTINHEINIRFSRAGEQITLLDGSSKQLDAETLIIADEIEPLAIAGVMGGLNSSVTSLTNDIFLESAYFVSEVIAKQKQFYQLHSDSAYRYERGVDYCLPMAAMERATQLILMIAGGESGPIIERKSLENLPKTTEISLPHKKVTRLLGISIPSVKIEAIFNALNIAWHYNDQSWQVIPPSYRPDLKIPEDFIEEIARIYGYEHIPIHQLKGNLEIDLSAQNQSDHGDIREFLANRGYHEIISYSFVDNFLQELLNPLEKVRELVNPITSDMTVMRTSLWPGLLKTYLYNKSRQQQRIRLFEVGTCFLTKEDKLLHETKLGGLIVGSPFPEQWGQPNREIDFFDIKGDVHDLIKTWHPEKKIEYTRDEFPALHQGQAASILIDGQKIGVLGLLHPFILQKLDISDKVYVFELAVKPFVEGSPVHFQEFSKFPEIRRDVALLVNEAIPAKDIQDTIRSCAGSWLKDIFIFDLYQGKGITPGLKSIALALILQHPTRTLVDEEVAETMKRVVTGLKDQLGAELRS